MKKVLILGAGKTGRGFIPRFIHQCEITFADIDQSIVDLLKESNEYNIEFYGNTRPSMKINYTKAIYAKSEEMIDSLENTDYLMISTDISQYKDVAEEIKEGIKRRNSQLVVITFENAISASQTLKSYLTSEEINKCQFADAGVFCTTNNKGIDIISQDLDYLPVSKINGKLPFLNLTHIQNFPELMERKIYTYNCLSAIIGYNGFVKGYEWLSDAASDKEIKQDISSLLENLNKIIAKKYNVTLEEQKEFANNAILKFSNVYIKDSIIRNINNAKRKLGEQERLIKPLKLISSTEARNVILKTIAYACYYDFSNELQLGEKLLDNVDLSESDRLMIHDYYIKCFK